MILSPLPKQTLSNQVAEQLRGAIKDGSLGPGTRLVERNIAEQLGVSRIPVREGIQQLVDEGLVTKLPHRGTFVYAPTRTELEEIASLRVVLERFAMERVAANWNSDHREQLIRITQAMGDAAYRKDYRQMFEQDVQFHRSLWQIADHSLLARGCLRPPCAHQSLSLRGGDGSSQRRPGCSCRWALRSSLTCLSEAT